jgi:hypothetical protein
MQRQIQKTKSLMTIEQANKATAADSKQFVEIGKFTKAFRTDSLTNIEAGESFVIPTDYKIFSQRILRGGQPVLDRDNNPVTAEFINVVTNKKRNVRFYPSSVTKVLFAVDENGKDLVGAERIKRSSGTLYEYCKGKDIDGVMNNLKGCEILCESLTPVNTRQFGVSNEDATAKDIVVQRVGQWELVGDKKPADWEA